MQVANRQVDLNLLFLLTKGRAVKHAGQLHRRLELKALDVDIFRHRALDAFKGILDLNAGRDGLGHHELVVPLRLLQQKRQLRWAGHVVLGQPPHRRSAGNSIQQRFVSARFGDTKFQTSQLGTPGHSYLNPFSLMIFAIVASEMLMS